MGRHSLEKEKKKINLKKELIAILIIIALVFGINFILSYRNIKTEKQQKENITSIIDSKTIEGEKLVIKSNSEYNRVVEYTFENNTLKTVKMYEKFEEKEKFEQTKKTYEVLKSIEIINVNEQELSIEIEKNDFGTDTGLTYEQIYDKYLVQIIGAYQVIK